MTTAPVLDPMARAALSKWFNALPNGSIGKEHFDALIELVAALPAPVGREPGERQEPVAYQVRHVQYRGEDAGWDTFTTLPSWATEKQKDSTPRWDVRALGLQATIEALDRALANSEAMRKVLANKYEKWFARATEAERALAERTRERDKAVQSRWTWHNYIVRVLAGYRAKLTAVEVLVTTLQARVAELETGLEESNSLFVAMLHEDREPPEIEEQVAANRTLLSDKPNV